MTIKTKLVQNFNVRSNKPNELVLNWNLPIDFEEGEEIIVARRSDAFPVELRNPNYEDRYTDVAQLEVFRGRPVYCSHLVVAGYTLTIANDNAFQPSSITEFDTANKYTGRLIRDSIGQVFKIVDNNETEITVESIATNTAKQTLPQEGAFLILADFPAEKTSTETINLLEASNTITIENNSFNAGDKITINGLTDLVYNTDWTMGVSAEDTAENIKEAIILSGYNFIVERYDNVVLIQRHEEGILSLATNNTTSIKINAYAVSGDKIFVEDNKFTKNQLRGLIVQFGISTYFVKSNNAKEIILYKTGMAYNELPNSIFSVVSSHNNTYVSGFSDKYRNYFEVVTKNGNGLQNNTFYYYTAFNSVIGTTVKCLNDDGTGQVVNFTVDKIGTNVQRIFFENLQFINNFDFTYNEIDGKITYESNPDLTEYGIQVGDLVADSDGKRFPIIDVAEVDQGIVGIATGQIVSTVRESRIHGSITRATPPADIANIEVGDTFFDLAGNGFEVTGTNANPTESFAPVPANAIDIFQGLTDKVVVTNEFQVPFTFNARTKKVQYGDRQITRNINLTPFDYNGLSGVIQYNGATIDLTVVAEGHYFVDGAGNKFEIDEVDHANQKLILATGLNVDNTVENQYDGGVIDIVGYQDIDGNDLISLIAVQPQDLFKTNSKNTIQIVEADDSEKTIQLDDSVTDISTLVQTIHDGSVLRRGKEVEWTGFDGELSENLQDNDQGGVKRYSSVYEVNFAYTSSPLSTQALGVSSQNRNMGKFIYRLWPKIPFQSIDTTGDLSDVMDVFGKEINELYTLIDNYQLQDADIVLPKYLNYAVNSLGTNMPSESLGIDTRRRMMRDLLSVYRLKGTREGITKFIKILTTWDITNGTGDFREVIIDDSPEVVGLRFYSPTLGEFNTRFIDTLEVESPPAGRFYKGIAGLTLPGFFEFIEILITLPNVALEIGNSTNISYVGNTTVLRDDNINFEQLNSFTGAFLIPDEANPKNFYKILGNSSNEITVLGTIPRENLGAKYIVLSPLNLNRFIALRAEIPKFLPHNTVAVFNFKTVN